MCRKVILINNYLLCVGFTVLQLKGNCFRSLWSCNVMFNATEWSCAIQVTHGPVQFDTARCISVSISIFRSWRGSKMANLCHFTFTIPFCQVQSIPKSDTKASSDQRFGVRLVKTHNYSWQAILPHSKGGPVHTAVTRGKTGQDVGTDMQKRSHSSHINPGFQLWGL